MSEQIALQENQTAQGIVLTSTGVVFSEAHSVKYEDVAQAIKRMGKLTRSAQFCLGDLINYADAQYGKTYEQWIELTGMSYQALANIAQTARRIPLSLRQENLDFSHHQLIAQGVKTEAGRKRWLETAVQHDLSFRELRTSIKRGEVMTRKDIAEETRKRSHSHDERGAEPHSVTLAKLTRWAQSTEDKFGEIESWDDLVKAQLQQEFQSLYVFLNRLYK